MCKSPTSTNCFGSHETLIFASFHLFSLYFQDTRTGKSCPGQHFCENPQDYPGDLILSLLKNQTFPSGLFDKAPSKKRSVDLINLITKDIVNFLSKEESDTDEMSNYIDDEPVTSTTEEVTTVFAHFVSDTQNGDPSIKV